MGFHYSPKPIIDNSLVLYLDAANSKSYISGSTIWNDVSRSGNNGVLINNPNFDGSSIVFNGVNNYATINTSIGSGDFTFNIWLKRQSTSTAVSFIFGRYVDSISRGCMFFIQNNLLFFRIGAAESLDRSVAFTSPVTGSSWTNIVASANRSSNVLLYRNGLLDNQTNISTQQGNIQTLNFIGAANGEIWFLNGNLGLVQVYNRALSSTEILQNFNAMRGRFGI